MFYARSCQLIGCLILLGWFPASGQDFSTAIWHAPLEQNPDSAIEGSIWPLPLTPRAEHWQAGIEPRVAWRDVPEAGAIQISRPGWAAGFALHRHAKTSIEGHARWDLDVQVSHFRVGAATADLWDEAWSTGGAGGAGWATTPDGQAVHLLRLWSSFKCQLGPSSELSIGHHPHHWGRGWRSIWLDRQMSPMPYLRYHVDAGRVQYTQLLGLTHAWGHGSPPLSPSGSSPLNPGRYKSRVPGWMVAQMVEVDLGHGFHGSLFGAIKWLHVDSAHTKRFEWTYAIPFVAFRPTEYMLGSADNALVGIGGGWASQRVPFDLSMALMFDEFVLDELRSNEDWWANKWATQITAKAHSKDGQWMGLIESIAARPFTYGHAGAGTAWVHGNSPLAHPAGANFMEFRGHARWKSVKGPWWVQAGVVHRKQGVDAAERYAFDAPEFTTGWNPLVGYGARPADYGIEWLNTGLGQVEGAQLRAQTSIWTSIERDIPKIPGHRVFVRCISRSDGQWRLETGLTASRVWDERGW